MYFVPDLLQDIFAGISASGMPQTPYMPVGFLPSLTLETETPGMSLPSLSMEDKTGFRDTAAGKAFDFSELDSLPDMKSLTSGNTGMEMAAGSMAMNLSYPGQRMSAPLFSEDVANLIRPELDLLDLCNPGFDNLDVLDMDTYVDMSVPSLDTDNTKVSGFGMGTNV